MPVLTAAAPAEVDCLGILPGVLNMPDKDWHTNGMMGEMLSTCWTEGGVQMPSERAALSLDAFLKGHCVSKSGQNPSK